MFRDTYDDDGNSRGYFQWAEFARSDSNQEVEQNLTAAVYAALFAEYSPRGIVPLKATPINEVVYVLFELSNESEP